MRLRMLTTVIHEYVENFLVDSGKPEYLSTWNGMKEKLNEIVTQSLLTEKQQRFDALFFTQ